MVFENVYMVKLVRVLGSGSTSGPGRVGSDIGARAPHNEPGNYEALFTPNHCARNLECIIKGLL